MSLLGSKYKLLHRLGGGGMAEVYTAQTIGAAGFARMVAIKRILGGLSDNDNFARMFIDEAQLCSRLQHPNIVSVLDFDRDPEGRFYLVMELVEGKDLDAVMERGVLPFAVVHYIVTEILRGLAYAHDLPTDDPEFHGVIHRDISPHNVLVSWEGAVKVSDFGIAKVRSASSATASVFIKGKPSYMSPEQANGERLDGRSDLFAVGIVLWEMLTGRRLFTGTDTRETLAKVLFAPIPSPSQFRAGIPADLEQVTMRLLSREVGARYGSSDEAVADLLACASASPRGREQFVDLLVERFAGQAPARRRRNAPTGASPLGSSGIVHGGSHANPLIAPAANHANIGHDATLTPTSGITARPADSSGVPVVAADVPSAPSHVATLLSSPLPRGPRVAPYEAPTRSHQSQDALITRTLDEATSSSTAAANLPKSRRWLLALVAGALVAVAAFFVARVFLGNGAQAGKDHAATEVATAEPANPQPAPAATGSGMVVPEVPPRPAFNNGPLADAHLADSVAAPAVAADPKAKPDEPASATADVTEPPRRATSGRATGRDSQASRPSPSEKPSGQTAPVEPTTSAQAAPATKAPGFVSISVDPWAEISIDGKAIGATPKKVPLTPGTHRIKLSNDAGKSYNKVVTIKPGETEVISLDWN